MSVLVGQNSQVCRDFFEMKEEPQCIFQTLQELRDSSRKKSQLKKMSFLSGKKVRYVCQEGRSVGKNNNKTSTTATTSTTASTATSHPLTRATHSVYPRPRLSRF